MKSLKEKIEVMQAALDGKEIEVDFSFTDKYELDTTPSWNWRDHDYRVKPEPLVRYMVVFDDGRNSGRTYRSKEQAVNDWGELTTFQRVAKLQEVME